MGVVVFMVFVVLGWVPYGVCEIMELSGKDTIKLPVGGLL